MTVDDPLPASIDELVALASGLAVSAGDLALRGRREAALGESTKSTSTDLVTVHDKAAERVIVAGITGARPRDHVLGEEGTDRPGTSGVSWYVDPIDGTTNFVYDLPLWSTSIAAGDADGMLAGVVYAPVLGELFVAARGRGATLNGAPVRCSDRADLGLSLVATGFGYRAETRIGQADLLHHVIGAVRDVRRLGSAALDLCYVAAGRYDVYYETGLNPWDAAAGELIAREAGCRSGDFHGGPARPDELLVATPAVFDAMTALLDGHR